MAQLKFSYSAYNIMEVVHSFGPLACISSRFIGKLSCLAFYIHSYLDMPLMVKSMTFLQRYIISVNTVAM